MIHQYKAKGFNIVLDIYSGSVHLVDDVTYKIIEDYEKKSKAEIKKDIINSFNLSDEEFENAYEEVLALIDSGQLFTEDNFKNLSIDVSKRPTTIKALCLNVAHTCNFTCEYCFAKGGKYHGPDAIMSKEVAKRAIDFLLKNSGGHHNLDIDFFGGEPLMNLDVVKFTVDYARSKEKEFN